jgi:hypothetical protein
MWGSKTLIANARVSLTLLSTTAQTAFAASGVSGDTGGTVVLGVLLKGGAAARVVTFRAVDDTPVYFTVTVPAATTIQLNIPFQFPAVEGLELVTDSATADVSADLFFYKPGAFGLGL